MIFRLNGVKLGDYKKGGKKFVKQTLIVNLFGVSKDVVFAGEYLTERLQKLHFDVRHFYDIPRDSNTFSRNDTVKVLVIYEQIREWIEDFNGIVDIIINECPLAKFAFYGQKCLSEDEQKDIIKNSKKYDNFNIMILPSKGGFKYNSEEDKILSFLQNNGISAIIINKMIEHLDQVVKDIEDQLCLLQYPTDTH